MNNGTLLPTETNGAFDLLHPVDQEEIVQLLPPDAVLDNLLQVLLARVAHDDAVTTPPRSLVQLASSPFGQSETIRHNKRLTYGLQFHPDATDSPSSAASQDSVARPSQTLPN